MNLIFIKQKAYPSKSCKNLIEYFETNLDKASPGKMGPHSLENLEIDLNLTSPDSYFDLGKTLEDGCKDFLKEYPIYDKYICKWNLNANCQLCRFKPSKHYSKIHCENDGDPQYLNRVFAWMIYLNDIEDGGETEFLLQNTKIKAEEGKLLIWPAGASHMHRGVVSESTTKYFLTGWFCYF